MNCSARAFMAVHEGAVANFLKIKKNNLIELTVASSIKQHLISRPCDTRYLFQVTSCPPSPKPEPSFPKEADGTIGRTRPPRRDQKEVTPLDLHPNNLQSSAWLLRPKRPLTINKPCTVATPWDHRFRACASLRSNTADTDTTWVSSASSRLRTTRRNWYTCLPAWARTRSPRSAPWWACRNLTWTWCVGISSACRSRMFQDWNGGAQWVILAIRCSSHKQY